MQTLKDLLESADLGAGGVKTASAKANAADLDGMDKLAMQLGLFGATEKVAAEDNEDKEDEKEDEKEEDEEGEKKEASAHTGSLHALLFPNSVLGGAEKTAAEKQAAAEMRLGALSFDQFARSVDGFIEKMASAALSGSAHGDSQAENRLPNNRPGDAGSAIDTDPEYTDEVKAKNDAKQVGHAEQTQVKAAAAFRKQMLLSQLVD